MFAHFAGILLILQTADSQGSKEKIIFGRLGSTIKLNCTNSTGVLAATVTWYKENLNKNLYKINRNNCVKEDTCSSNQCHLTISNMQRHHSGVYSCIMVPEQGDLTLQNRIRVVITENLKPNPSILVPSSLKEKPLKHDIPLLCFFFGVSPTSTPIFWNISGEISQDGMDGDMIDGEGTFILWSLKLIPQEQWHPGMSYTCKYPGSRSDQAAVPSQEVSSGNED